MRIGVLLPQTELGGDAGAVRAYGQAVDELGYSHVLAFEHVVGADPRVHTGWSGVYDVDTTFHEPFPLFGFLAAITSLELVTGVVILPQRQTVLVAKQAAEVDMLAEGRFRLGVGLGWNPVEYEALGKSFGDRGRRIGEQVQLLRRLWTERTVTFDGTYERVTGAGLMPRPIQQPIPVWFGGTAKPALRRAGALADGWFPLVRPGEALDAARREVDAGARAAGRDPASIGMEGRVVWRGSVDKLVEHVASWRDAGASHVGINTMGAGLGGVDGHLDVLAQAAAALDLKR